MLEDVALSSYRHGWFSMDELKSTVRELLPRQLPGPDISGEGQSA
jgi:hypothetical protein